VDAAEGPLSASSLVTKTSNGLRAVAAHRRTVETLPGDSKMRRRDRAPKPRQKALQCELGTEERVRTPSPNPPQVLPQHKDRQEPRAS
jgi:hypothetical protein